MDDVKRRHASMKTEYIINPVDWQETVKRNGDSKWTIDSKRQPGTTYIVQRIANGPTACNCIELVCTLLFFFFFFI